MQPQLGVRLRLLRAASARFVSHHVRRVLAATYQLAGYRVRRRGTHPYSSIAYHCQQLRTLVSNCVPLVLNSVRVLLMNVPILRVRSGLFRAWQ